MDIMSIDNRDVLFKIYNPYASQNCFVCIFYWLFGCSLQPANEKDSYPVYIKENVLYTHRPCPISRFLKSANQYQIYSPVWNDGPILQITIYDREVDIHLTNRYSFSLKGNDKNIFLQKISKAYMEHVAQEYMEPLK